MGPRPSEPMGMNLGGILPAAGLAAIQAAEKAQAEIANAVPVIQGLAGHIRAAWETNKRAKEATEARMLASIRQRRGVYDPDKLQLLKQSGGSQIYMMLTAAKCRAVSAWLRDVLLAAGTDKPWTLEATPLPELPPDITQAIEARAQQDQNMALLLGQSLPPEQGQELVAAQRDKALADLRDEARRRTEALERKMDDQLVEGRFTEAFMAFTDDIATFPAAILKGPVVRKRTQLRWNQDPATGTWTMSQEERLLPEWERVDPFNLFPAPHAADVNTGDLIELHRLSRADLYAMQGTEGYSDEAIRAVLDEHGSGGLREWTTLDSTRAAAEGRDSDADNPGQTIDTLQFWGSVQGKLLVEWGLPEEQVPDPLAEYEIEAWLIGRWVIKAIVNPDPLGRRPYYKTCYEKLPGLFWGNAPPDLIRDVQDMCNAAARALANNMGIASGPQAFVNIDRLPPGEDVTQMFPWKIWQVQSDPTGGSGDPVKFFQPNSNAQELLQIYQQFSILADEYSGVPRYMTGNNPSGGAGRTASGLSMLISHAGKIMQQVIANIDTDVIAPLLERLHHYNMRYGEDETIKGDVKVVARGIHSLTVREAAQVRRTEFLQATGNPVDMQIIGMEGRAAVLREVAKSLEMDVDKVVPDPARIRANMAVQQMQQAAMAQQAPPGPQDPQAPPGGADQELMDGSPVTDHF